MPLLEGVATLLGFAYLILAIREQRVCWIAGGLASLLFLFVFWRSSLPMQALLQVYYVIIAIHGWYYWGRPRAADGHPVTRVSALYHLAVLGLWITLSVLTQLLRQELYEPVAWLDSSTSWGGVLATWMVARKKLEAWLYWTVIDAATVALYLKAGLLASSGLYGVYTLLAVIAWKQWWTSYQQTTAGS